MQKSKTEIIQETADTYHLGNRAFCDVTLSCVYLDPETGNKCALGRCFKAEDVILLELTGTIDEDGSIHNIKKDSWEVAEDLLKEEYRGHSPLFWEDLQTFHDVESYWSNDGLSERGKEKMESLLDKWG